MAGEHLYSQAPGVVHIGLGADEMVDELTIQWSKETIQRHVNVVGNRHILIKEEDGAVHTVKPGESLPY